MEERTVINSDEIKKAVEHGQESNSARRENLAEGDSLIRFKAYDPDEAYRRLKAIRQNMRLLKKQIEEAGTRSLPAALLEKYEKLWQDFRAIEKDEAAIIAYGEEPQI